MEKLLEQAKKELKEIQEKGINAGNLDLAAKLSTIALNLTEIQEKEKEKEEGGQQMYGYGAYRDGRGGGYNEGGYGRGGYNEGGYGRGGGGYGEGGYGAYEGEYGRRGVPGSGRGRYNNRMREHMDQMMSGMDQYEYGRERYQYGGGDEGRMQEGLEKLMYALCMFVESAMDFAETPQEKEIIRKHVQKISRI